MLAALSALANSPVVADPVQAFWQDVHQEPPDELVGGQRHRFVARWSFHRKSFHLKVTPFWPHATKRLLAMATRWV